MKPRLIYIYVIGIPGLLWVASLSKYSSKQKGGYIAELGDEFWGRVSSFLGIESGVSGFQGHLSSGDNHIEEAHHEVLRFPYGTLPHRIYKQ